MTTTPALVFPIEDLVTCSKPGMTCSQWLYHFPCQPDHHMVLPHIAGAIMAVGVGFHRNFLVIDMKLTLVLPMFGNPVDRRMLRLYWGWVYHKVDMRSYPHIDRYYAEKQRHIAYGGSNNEQSISRAFALYLDSYCRDHIEKIALADEIDAPLRNRPDDTVRDSPPHDLRPAGRDISVRMASALFPYSTATRGPSKTMLSRR